MNKYLIYSLFFLLIWPAEYAYAYKLPDLGSPSQSLYTQQEVRQLSDSYMREIQQSPQYIQDPLLNEYIQNLGNRLVANDDSRSQPFHFFILGIPEINAFAGPGGFVGIYSGLILASRNESELAAVMSHEIAHVTQHHILRSIAREKRMRIPMLAGIIAAAALGYANPALAEGAAMLGISGYMQSAIAFTRGHEKEADRIGIQTLENSGFDPTAMAGFFQQMQLQDRLSIINDVPLILRTHPLNAERIADAENRAAQFSKHKYRNSLRYRLMKARVRVITTSDIQGTINYFKQQSPTVENRYGLGLAFLLAQSYQQAKKTLLPLTQQHPNNLVYSLALANTEVAMQQYKPALLMLKTAYENFPDSRPVLLAYSDALMKMGDNKLAADILQKAIYDHQKDIYLWQVLSIAQNKSGQQALAYFSLAKSYMLLDESGVANRYLERSLKLSKTNSLLVLQIKALQHKIKQSAS